MFLFAFCFLSEDPIFSWPKLRFVIMNQRLISLLYENVSKTKLGRKKIRDQIGSSLFFSLLKKNEILDKRFEHILF